MTQLQGVVMGTAADLLLARWVANGTFMVPLVSENGTVQQPITLCSPGLPVTNHGYCRK